MKELISNGSVIFGDRRYAIPSKKDLKKWDYQEWKEGRSTYKKLWIDSYDYTKDGVCIFSSCLEVKNGKSATLDDKKLKDADLEKALLVFKTIDEESL